MMLGADEAFDAGEEGRVADGLQHGGAVEAAAAFAHDLARNFFAGGWVVGVDAGEAEAEGLIGVDVGQLAGGLEFAGGLIDDLGEGVLERFEVFGGEEAGFEQEALAVEVGEFVWCEAHDSCPISFSQCNC